MEFELRFLKPGTLCHAGIKKQIKSSDLKFGFENSVDMDDENLNC